MYGIGKWLVLDIFIYFVMLINLGLDFNRFWK